MRPTRQLTVAALFVAAAAIAFAQPKTVASTVAAPAESAPVTLSKFIVNESSDRGYYSANAISATRINTPIKELPVNVQVVTEEFLKDIGAFNFIQSALQWQANVASNGIRGFALSTRVNGMNNSETDDFIAFSRVELIKGPSAIISGSSPPGGLINAVTKVPLFRQRVQLDQVFSEDYTRTSFDLNLVALAGKLGLRFAGAAQRDSVVETFYEDQSVSRNSWFGVGEFRPFAKTTVRVTGMLMKESWTSRQAPTGNYANLGRIAPNPANPALPTVYAFEAPFNFPLGFNLVGSGAYNDIDDYRIINEIEQGVGDHLDLSVIYTVKKRQRNALEPVLSGGLRTVGADRFIATRWRNIFGTNPWSENLQAKALFHFDALGAKHKILAGTTWAVGNGNRFVSVQSTNENGSAQEFLYRLGDLNPNKERPNSLRFVYPAIVRPTSGGEKNLFVVHNASWMNGKLHTLVGAYDYNFEATSFIAVRNNFVTLEKGGFRPQFGAVYQWNDQVGVYANYARSIQPFGDRNTANELLPATEGENQEVGVKLDNFWQGRLSGTFSLYSAKFKNRFIFDPTEPRADGLKNADGTPTLGELVANGEDQAYGFDADAIYSPVPNWQIVISYAYNDTTITKDRKDRPGFIGQRVSGHAWNTYAIWNKYAFARGPLKGLALGGGFRGDDGRLRSYRTVNGVLVEANNTKKPYAEAYAAYRGKFGQTGYYVSLNVKNILTQDIFFDYATNSTQPYAKFDARKPVVLTMGLEF